VNEEESESGKTGMDFLSRTLSSEGFNIAEQKVKDFMAFRLPKSKSELSSFLGLAGFLRRGVRVFADASQPLWEVINAKTFVWSRQAAEAFEEVKSRIANATAVSFFVNTAETKLYSEASELALGAVLLQIQDGKEKTIAFASRLCTSAPVQREITHKRKEKLWHRSGQSNTFDITLWAAK
jgi:RNase H-like domain found in reverse transcriptase